MPPPAGRHADPFSMVGKPLPTSYQGVDLERVRHRLGHGDLITTTRYVKILDEEGSTAADVMSKLLKAVG